MTMTEKIIANHSNQKAVTAGDIVTCKVDWAVLHDMFFSVGGQFDLYKIKSIFNPQRYVVVMDHAVPAPTVNDAEAGVKARRFVERYGIHSFFDVGNHGVVHQVLAEKGLALPGQLIACGDSHTCASGALNCAARGMGPLDMVYISCTGETWYQVSPTILYKLVGTLPEMVSGKDLFLYLAGLYGDVTNKNVEFSGPGVASLSIANRQSIATMCAEINAEFVIFPCDDRLLEYLEGKAAEEFSPVDSDLDAAYEEVREINLNEIGPYVALPHYIPNNCKPVADLEGLKIDQALIGSCSNGRLEDIGVAAQIVQGKKVACGVRLIVTPASQAIYKEALKAGYLEILVEAGAVVTNPTCGACYGGHMGLIGSGERCLSSTTRNFQGRMGSAASEVLLAAPATVAASALTGKITDPRRYKL